MSTLCTQQTATNHLKLGFGLFGVTTVSCKTPKPFHCFLQRFVKHSKTFHKLFQEVPEDETLTQSECSAVFIHLLLVEKGNKKKTLRVKVLQRMRWNKQFEHCPVAAFTCALQKDLLFHGKLFVSKNYLCFHSSMLLTVTKVTCTSPLKLFHVCLVTWTLS